MNNPAQWPKKGIQQRTLYLIAIYSIFLGLLYSLVIVAYAWVVEDNIFNRLVNNEAVYLKEVYKSSGEITTPRLQFIQLYGSRSALPGNIPVLLEQDPERVEFVLDRGPTLHIKPVILGELEMVLVADISAYEVSTDFLPEVTIWLSLMLVLLVVLGLLLAFWVSSYTLKPLQSLAYAISRSKQQPISPGFARAYPKDEIGYLAKTFEDTLLYKQVILKRESDFTRDISHELRTPLSVLRNIISKVAGTGRISLMEIERLQKSSSEMQRTISTLLALARQESLERQEVSLLFVLEKSILNHVQASPDSLLTFELQVSAEEKVRANENLLLHLFTNLIENADHYASDHKLSIKFSQGNLHFSNNIDEIQQKLIKDPFTESAKNKHSSGLGQGLYLVKRICEMCSWQARYQCAQSRFEIIIRT
ncbi:sensor histidine kinase [Microbulbifer sp. EKSA008]|uniref:sensor histidine kinase n=1 Tax=unclassified Microbulbifer TaxID=2619833 RepID=UPI0039B461F9